MKNQKGISGVVAMVIMVGLVLVAVSLVWTTVSNLITEELEETGSCFGIFGEVTINNQYTCYNSTSDEMQFSISIGDIDVDEILIAISGEGATESIKIGNDGRTITNVRNYDGSTNITLPGKNGGLTYIKSNFPTKPDLIKIAPIVNGKQCEIADTLAQIDDCFLLKI